ncbi:MAG: UDP-N-acetylmuramate dehydrogenase [Gammaproteobacteria bacterium]|nr:UDP-N-acetylmuramate dehydrogenase [Gammaproteobacteria bacterium]MCH9744072.1 UDP-N-acetylmuramate dehydrogenase [Gammaproteobacteria bacterium]
MMLQNQSLKALNSFGIDVKTRWLAHIKSIDEAQQLFQDPQWHDTPILILGSGSNVLLINDFDGLVIKNEIMGIKEIKQDDKHVWLQIGAGECWHDLVLYCLEHNYAGIENLSLIPGTVGAAPMQNIGAYGVELASVFESLQAVKRSDGSLETFNNEQCQFAYRSSIFKRELKDQYCICTATLRLNKVHDTLALNYGRIKHTLEEMGIDEPNIKNISDAVIQIRQSKLPDPKKIGNAGSFFKNPQFALKDFEEIKKRFPNIPRFPGENDTIKISAAWLIEKAGWRGKQLGKAAVYPQHALVLINQDGASGRDILTLAEKIEADVKQQFNIKLEPEVNVIL